MKREEMLGKPGQITKNRPQTAPVREELWNVPSKKQGRYKGKNEGEHEVTRDKGFQCAH